MFIVESGTPLLGRTWIRQLRINLLDLDKTHIPESMCSESIYCLNTHKDVVIKILQQFNDIFQPEVGCIPNFTCSLKLREEAKPVFLKALDEESKIIQTISIHRGTYKINRLSFGIKTASSEFHRILDQILSDLDGITTYFDDIVISYLGYIIEENTISKCPNKVKAILEAPRPKNTENVKKFLGLITYYSRFIPNVSTTTYPIQELLQKEKKFSWSSSCEVASIKLKEEIASDRVLMPYNPSLPVTVAYDASPSGIAGVLSHIVEGIEKPPVGQGNPCHYIFNPEILPVYGRPFTLISDNRPLTRIFQHNTKLPAITSARLLRYATFLSNFNYKVEHRKGEDHGNVDYLSRASLEFKSTAQDEEINNQIINQIATTIITSKTIVEETMKDEELSQLKENLSSGETYDLIYSLHNGIIFRGHRIFIPTSLRPEILKELHYTHLGISKMKKLARRYCYWRNIDKDIEKPVHIDYAGPFQGHQFLVLVDAKSKWPERNGIFQKFTAPGHPATNGLAERYVQILKKKLKAMEFDPSTITSKVENILYRFRTTPLHCGNSPSEIYLNRQIRTSLDLLRPPSTSPTSTQECHIRQLSVGDRVQSRAYSGTQRWKLGVITKKLGRLHYLIHLDEGYLIKRHINQLRPSEAPKEKSERKSVHFGPVTRNWYPLLDNTPELQSRAEEQSHQIRTPAKDPAPAAQNIQTPIGESAIRESQGQNPPLRRSERLRRPPTYLNNFVPK
ncbi:PREDICTED: uncharacterized protein LOC108769509 [Trachymyrmex cornetzi]|uniref:uncharacterized protein LOC108769509 n=1 Tax=Trachymyrmex cornetzi TaxID=471704 RepID=UPI00084EF46D|nr:PREDICTED: uncharacterized protein LOC108769509 [Trachymyrmex cornetzi]